MIEILWFSAINHFNAKKSLLIANCTLSNSNTSRMWLYESRFCDVLFSFRSFRLFRLADHWCASPYCGRGRHANTAGDTLSKPRSVCERGTATSERCKAFFLTLFFLQRVADQLSNSQTLEQLLSTALIFFSRSLFSLRCSFYFCFIFLALSLTLESLSLSRKHETYISFSMYCVCMI